MMLFLAGFSLGFLSFFFILSLCMVGKGNKYE